MSEISDIFLLLPNWCLIQSIHNEHNAVIPQQ